MVEFGLLGPLEILVDGRPLELGSTKQRALLAILLLHANAVVARDFLIDELWGERAPPSAAHGIDAYVSRLRKVLDEGEGRQILVTRAPGYLLRVGFDELDLHRFERLLADGRRELLAEEPSRATEKLQEALALWRGAVLADLEFQGLTRIEIDRLEELRLAAVEDRIEADLALGRDSELIPELQALVARNPLRERLRGQLMRALYHCGRQAEALEGFREARAYLGEELGLEPGRLLKGLEQEILRQDEGLELPAAPGQLLAETPAPAEKEHAVPPVKPQTPAEQQHAAPPVKPSAPLAAVRRSRLTAAALAVAAFALVAAVAVVLLPGGASVAVAPNSVAVIDPASNRVVDDIGVGGQARAVVVGRNSVWAASPDRKTVSRIDAKTRVVTDTLPLDIEPDDIAVAYGSLWVVVSDGTAERVNPTSGQVIWRGNVSPGVVAPGESTLHYLGHPTLCGPAGGSAGPLGDGHIALAVGSGTMWSVCSGSVASRIDVRDDTFALTYLNGYNPIAIAFGLGGVWVANHGDGTLTRISARTNQVTDTIPMGTAPSAVAVGAGGVWAADFQRDSVSRLRVTGGGRPPFVVSRIPVGDGPVALAVGESGVWVANRGGTVSRIDPKTEHVKTVELGAVQPVDIAVGGGDVWVTVRPREPY